MTPFVIKLVSEVYGRFRRVSFSEEMTEGFWLVGLYILIVALNRQIVILDYLPLTTIKTLRMIWIFQLEIPRLMCICWH